MSFGTVSSELHAYNGDVCKSKTLPANTSASTDAFTGAGVLCGNELVITADTAISLSATKVLTFELTECATESGSFTVAAPITSFTGAKSFAVGDEIARFVPASTVKRFMKVKITDDEDLSASKINIRIVHKG